MEQSDALLLEKIADQDMEAFNLLYLRYKELFRNWTLKKTKDQDITHEILQNFWINVWTDPQKIKTNNQQSAKSFLFHVLNFRILDYYKSAYARSYANGEDFPDKIVRDISYSHVIEELELKEISAAIDFILDSQPERVKKIFRLRWTENYSYKEMAEALNISERTAREQFNWSMNLVRKKLQKFYAR